MFRITEIYNNIKFDPAYIAEFGFSCYIDEAGLLFDTGGNGDTLLKNISALGITPGDIQKLVLSHDHWDHKGGLGAVLEANSSLDVYVLSEFSDETLDYIGERANMIVVNGWTEIAGNIFSTGPLGSDIVEQSLVLDTGEGQFLIVGCSHPHISNILGYARQRGDVWGLMGGLHDVSVEDIDSLSGLKYLSASHCTRRLDEIVNRYPDTYVAGGVGRVHML